MDIAEQRNIPSFTTRVRFIAEAILEAFCEKALGNRPSRKWRPTRQEWFCTCIDCEPIRAFLSTERLVAKFKIRKEVQTHIAMRLDHIKSTLSCDFFVNNAEIDTIVVKKLLTHDANAVIQYSHLVGHVTRHLPPLYYWLSATLSFLSRISNSITLLPNGQKTALFCAPQMP